MEPTTEEKKGILKAIIAELERAKYSDEMMGKAWQSIGNAQNAENSAKAVSEKMKLLAKFTEDLEALA